MLPGPLLAIMQDIYWPRVNSLSVFCSLAGVPRGDFDCAKPDLWTFFETLAGHMHVITPRDMDSNAIESSSSLSSGNIPT